MALEGGELIVCCVVVGALIENIAQRGGQFHPLAEFVDYLSVEQEHVFELAGGQFVAVVFAADVPFPFLVWHNVEQKLILHIAEPRGVCAVHGHTARSPLESVVETEPAEGRTVDFSSDRPRSADRVDVGIL